MPEDPHAATDLAKKGQFPIDFGTFFFKGQSMGTGQAPEGYKNFDDRLDGWTKVLLHP